jgi:hypothetical protein
MRSIAEWMSELEQQARGGAPARGHAMLISGVTRIEVSCEAGSDRLQWAVNRREVVREVAERALAHARAWPKLAFTAYRP